MAWPPRWWPTLRFLSEKTLKRFRFNDQLWWQFMDTNSLVCEKFLLLPVAALDLCSCFSFCFTSVVVQLHKSRGIHIIKNQADIKMFIYALCHIFVYVVITTPLSKSDRCFSHRDVVCLSDVCHFWAQAQNGDWSQTGLHRTEHIAQFHRVRVRPNCCRRLDFSPRVSWRNLEPMLQRLDVW